MPRLAHITALLLVLGCGGKNTPSASSKASAQAGLAKLTIMNDMDGAPLPDAENATVVVFFATWCKPCQKELATLGELRQEIPNLRVLGVNAYEEWGDQSDEARMRAFRDTHAPWLPVVRGNDAFLEVFGGVPRIPTMFVYDRSGQLVAEFRRGRDKLPDKDELRRAIARATL